MKKILSFKRRNIQENILTDTQYTALYDGRNEKKYSGNWIFLLNKKQIRSSLSIKAVLANNSALDLNIKSIIPSGSVGSDFKLDIKVLMLDDSCTLKIIPSMEISENLIQAKHSLSISNIDHDQLFYLQSKGLTVSQAIDLIVEGFINN